MSPAHLPVLVLAVAAAPAPASLANDSAWDDAALPAAPFAVAAGTAAQFKYQPEKDAPDPAPAPQAVAGGGSEEELAKKLSNPVADLISVPLQFNYNTGFGPYEAQQFTLNIQPVIPIGISEDWNMIIRTILPLIAQEALSSNINGEDGLGDTTQSFFFSPKAPVGGWIVGFGPVFLWPTATSSVLGSGKWGAGPTAVVLRQEHGWTYGALVNHIWSYAGQSEREEVNSTFLQPFLSFTWPSATSLTLNTETTYNWAAEEWSVPLNLMVAQVVRIGRLPVQFQVGARYYAQSFEGGADGWGARFNVTFLFPK